MFDDPLPRDKDLRFLITTTMESIQVRTKYIEPAKAGLPALAVQIMRLVDSYMIWVGITEETAETVADAPRGGMLCRDWACAMPPASGSAGMQQAGPATTLYRTSGSDVAFSMAQRLAKRVGHPVFLSVDVGVAELVMEAERGVVLSLSEMVADTS